MWGDTTQAGLDIVLEASETLANDHAWCVVVAAAIVVFELAAPVTAAVVVLAAVVVAAASCSFNCSMPAVVFCECYRMRLRSFCACFFQIMHIQVKVKFKGFLN